MKHYTVILIKPDYLAIQYGKDFHITHVFEENVQDAQMAAQRDAFRADDLIGNAGNQEDYAVVAVFEGVHHDIKEKQ